MSRSLTTASARRAGIHIYLDGIDQRTNVLFDQLNEPFHVNDKTPIRIGAAGGKFFQGGIRDVRIYARALAPDEAAALSAPQTLARNRGHSRWCAQFTAVAEDGAGLSSPKEHRRF